MADPQMKKINVATQMVSRWLKSMVTPLY